jgi:hypothetical protein
MKLIDLINAQPTLARLANERMPAKLAYAIAKNLRMVNQELGDYDKARLALLDVFGKLNPETKQYDIPPEKKDQADAEYAELVQTEVKFSPHQINVETLGDLFVTPGELAVLYWMISDD